MFNPRTDNISGFDLPLNVQQKQVVRDRVNLLNERYRAKRAEAQLADRRALQHSHPVSESERSLAAYLQDCAVRAEREMNEVTKEIEKLNGCLTFHIGIKRPKPRT
jgi:hypothetical protein